MFNIKKWINSAPKIEDAEMDFLGEKVKVRALRGNAWEKYLKSYSNPAYNATATALYYGLINEETGEQYSMEDIEALYEKYTAEAGNLASNIVDMSMRIITEESRILAAKEKNSANPDTCDGSTSGVGTTE
ncbi:MAG: hypothetical protein FWC43_14560 [Planctomycetaceae bacterium]|nr:hypothetical protein [Planctomycetaceae bacterium]